MSNLNPVTEPAEASQLPALSAIAALTELANRHNLPELLKSTEPTQPTKISEKQLAANRANAAKSTGPTSEEGKNNSRMNASKHGLTGIAVLMRPEEREARDIFIAAFLRRLAPDGPIETEYSEAIAEQTWRLKRARSLDQNIFALSDPALYNKPGVHNHPEIDRAVAHAKGFVENSAEFQRLTTYERRLELSVERNTAALEKLQAQRKADRAEALLLATELARLNHAKGLPYNPAEDFPAENGFVFSDTEINLALDLADRKKHSKFLRNNGWDLKKEVYPKHPPIVERSKAA